MIDEVEMVGAAFDVPEPLTELRPHQWNRLQEKVWKYMMYDRRGDGQRWQAVRALIKRGFWVCGLEFEECKRIFDEYGEHLRERGVDGGSEGEHFCLDGILRCTAAMKSKKETHVKQTSQEYRMQQVRQGTWDYRQGCVCEYCQEYYRLYIR